MAGVERQNGIRDIPTIQGLCSFCLRGSCHFCAVQHNCIRFCLPSKILACTFDHTKILNIHVSCRWAGSRSEHGLAGSRSKHGLAGSRSKHGLSGSRSKHGLTGSRSEHGLAGSRSEHGLAGSRSEHGLTGSRNEHGLTGVVYLRRVSAQQS